MTDSSSEPVISGNRHTDQSGRFSSLCSRILASHKHAGCVLGFPGMNLMHYETLPMQYTEIFKVVKNENFQ